MEEKNIPKKLRTAVRPRRKVWIILLLVGVIALVIPFLFDFQTSCKYPNLFTSLGGSLLILAGILFAGNQAARIALTDAFSKLYEEESSTEQYHAKKKVFTFGRAVLAKENRYLAARVLMKSYPKEKQNEIHEARRKLKHFWLLAEAYYESSLMSSSEVFAVAGSPEILLSLEPLEVLAAEQIKFPMKGGPWTSIKLLKKWNKINGNKKEKKKLVELLPLDKELYNESILNDPPKT